MNNSLTKNYTLLLIEENSEALTTIINNLKDQGINITTLVLTDTANINNIDIVNPNIYKSFDDIHICKDQCKVLLKDKEVKLSYKEFKLLKLFTDQPYKVWTRNELLDNIWSVDFFGDPKTVDVHINWLRKKLDLKSTNSKYLITVRGIGYRFI
jgi:hypothetical protein